MKPEKLVLFFHVGHSVTVPATGRICNLGCATDHHYLFLLFSFTNEVLVQRDLMWYWKATSLFFCLMVLFTSSFDSYIET